MTLPAERITIEFESETGIWAPTGHDPFSNLDDRAWTPSRAMDWFRKGNPSALPYSISTALHSGAMRYIVRSELLYPKWIAFGRLNADTLEQLTPPPGCRLETNDIAVFMRFDDPEPLSLEQPLALSRCADNPPTDLHQHLPNGPFARTVDRHLPANMGADGHV